MTQKEFEDINLQRGYIRRPDGSWIISSLATPAEMIYHLNWLSTRTDLPHAQVGLY